jgi:hypothetical protein
MAEQWDEERGMGRRAGVVAEAEMQRDVSNEDVDDKKKLDDTVVKTDKVEVLIKCYAELAESGRLQGSVAAIITEWQVSVLRPKLLRVLSSNDSGIVIAEDTWISVSRVLCLESARRQSLIFMPFMNLFPAFFSSIWVSFSCSFLSRATR